ncbi:MAG: response regulator transcription factor [Lachnospiraceae bacterium]|jgi:DNA-binding response OmpR family regulator|nr:response regulator transcription factor [Lachnospiraceae bacterium]
MKILFLEDDPAIATGLEYSLKNEGYEVKWVSKVSDAMAAVSSETFDLCILDINLPDGNGYEVCKEIKKNLEIPVIFLTAYDDEVNVVMGLDYGADDYISKPFRVRELMARIKTVMRRYSSAGGEGVIKIGNITINTKQAKVLKDGVDVELTAVEYKLLLILLNNRGVVLSRNKLLENMWDIEGDFVNDNTLTVYIKRLRDKIEEDSANPAIVKTVRGLGYIIDNEE